MLPQWSLAPDCTVNKLRSARCARARQSMCVGTQESSGREEKVTAHNNQPATNLKATPLMQ